MPFGYTWGELGNAGLAGLDGPRQALFNLGPFLVGRSGQGPQTGSELLSRLGANPDSAWTTGLGMGIDLVADPTNLVGMGAANRAAQGGRAAGRAVNAAPEAAGLAQRLERFAGTGLQE